MFQEISKPKYDFLQLLLTIVSLSLTITSQSTILYILTHHEMIDDTKKVKKISQMIIL